MMQKPGVLKRIGYAIKFFRHGRGAFPPPTRTKANALPLYWPTWRDGVPQWQMVDYGAYAQEGFSENSVVYSAIMYKARAITAAPLRAYSGTFDEPELLPADHPLQQLAQRPNQYMSWAEYQGLAEVYFNLSGNCYGLTLRANNPVAKAYLCDGCGSVAFEGRGCFHCSSPDYGGHKSFLLRDLDGVRHTCGNCGRRVTGARCYACGTRAGLKSPDRRAEKVPVTVFPLRPDRVFIVPSNDRKKRLGFWYVPEGRSWQEGIPYLPQDVVHVKLPNPADPLEGLGYGLSPLSPGARSTDVDNEITRYFKLFFQNGAMPPGVLSFDVPMDDTTVAAARERWMEIYGGVDNWSEVAVLDQGGKYQRVGLTFDEMDVSVLDARNESRACGPFGVPLTLIESRPELVQATYNNKSTDRVMFWQDTMVPELQLFEVEYQYYFQGASGEFVQFDLSKVPALAPTPAEQREAATQAFKAGGIIRDEYRAAMGWGPAPDDTGNVYLLPMTLTEVPVGKRPVAETPTPTPEPEPQQQDDTQEGMPEAEEEAEEQEQQPAGKATKASAWTPERKLAFWKANDAHARAWEEKFGEAADRCFERDRRELLALVGQAKANALRRKQTVAWQETLLAAQDYLWAAGDGWREEFVPLISALVVERGETLNAEFGMSFDVHNLLAEQSFQDYVIQFAQPIMRTTNDEITALLKKGMEEGWSIETGQNALEALFARWMENADLTEEQLAWFEDRMPPYRRENIMRTETLRGSNFGNHETYKAWGVEMKEWLGTGDKRIRPAHLEAWENYSEGGKIGPIPLEEPFIVDNEPLLYPGDPNGSAKNVCSCRCTSLPYFPGQAE